MRIAGHGSGCVARRGVLLAALALAACGGPPKVPPTTVAGSVAAAAGLNTSVSGRPSPLLLRLYELKADTAFTAADFVSLYQRDQGELGAELVAREDLTLQPGQSLPLRRTLAPETRFIGVFAAYRDIEHARWRVVLPVRPGQAHQLTVRAGALAVSAEMAP
ncbi:type VI secretion system lipoprotein TssJ [Pseudorhodoferax sp.]|uniref:type VI secretion system lipoprotein TssJ n=1 Tax=Pseudorhodoferax sp. TaxID=1993553 RepID=UPI0039E71D98